jgi:hypothetical protein
MQIVNVVSSVSFRYLSWLTDFLELRPSEEASSYAATQELPNILWNPKVHYYA